MTSFVCALSIKHRNSRKWEKFKVGLKLILLDKDSGVKGEIGHFRELTTARTSIQATQSLKVVLETNSRVVDVLNTASELGQRIDEVAENLASLKDAYDKRKPDETTRKHLQNVRTKLGLDDSVTKASKDICDKLWNIYLPDMAKPVREARQTRRIPQMGRTERDRGQRYLWADW